MARVRSPNYPAFSLPEALTRIKTIHGAEQHLAAPKEVIAKHLGYGGMNGASIKAISALTKYGLLEEVSGDRVKVSPLAISILFPAKPEEKARAIREAAFKPPLFGEIYAEWGGAQPSDENLRAYLIRRQFASDALDRVIQSYKDTMELVTRESGAYPASELPASGKQEQDDMETQRVRHQTKTPLPYETTFTPAGSAEPFRVSFTGNGIEVGGRLTSPERADELIRAIQALKVLLQPVGSGKRPEEEKPDA